jgi:hypothetical protein
MLQELAFRLRVQNLRGVILIFKVSLWWVGLVFFKHAICLSEDADQLALVVNMEGLQVLMGDLSEFAALSSILQLVSMNFIAHVCNADSCKDSMEHKRSAMDAVFKDRRMIQV